MVENMLFNAGDMRSIPGWEAKIPHAVEQLSPRAAAKPVPQTESSRAVTREPERRNHEPSRSRARASRQEEAVCTATGESLCAAAKTRG